MLLVHRFILECITMLSLSRVTKCLVTVLDGRVKGEFIYQVNNAIKSKRYKGKGFPYSLPSVGP